MCKKEMIFTSQNINLIGTAISEVQKFRSLLSKVLLMLTKGYNFFISLFSIFIDLCRKY